MNGASNLVWISALAASSLLAGCNSSREVEVAGEVSAPASVQVEGPILLDFLDVLADDDTPKSVHTATLETLGEFSEKVELEGDTVRIVAIDDRDENGACTDGEPWATIDATIEEDDSVDPVKLELTTAACPKAE